MLYSNWMNENGFAKDAITKYKKPSLKKGKAFQ
jgi:hypothetical protein